MTAETAYDLLERAHNLLSNAYLNPLPDKFEQQCVIADLVRVRVLYRRAYDALKDPEDE